MQYSSGPEPPRHTQTWANPEIKLMAFDGLDTGPKFFVQEPQGPITMMVMIMTMRLGIWSIF